MHILILECPILLGYLYGMLWLPASQIRRAAKGLLCNSESVCVISRHQCWECALAPQFYRTLDSLQQAQAGLQDAIQLQGQHDRSFRSSALWPAARVHQDCLSKFLLGAEEGDCWHLLVGMNRVIMTAKGTRSHWLQAPSISPYPSKPNNAIHTKGAFRRGFRSQRTWSNKWSKKFTIYASGEGKPLYL